jgi:hypothetical protein
MLHQRDKTAGHQRSDLQLRWWPGAGSNRRPSDFQAHAIVALILNAPHEMFLRLLPATAKRSHTGHVDH